MKPVRQFWSPKRGVEPIAKPAEQGPAPPVFGFSTPGPANRSRLVELPEKGERRAARRDHLLITQEQEEAMYATIRRYSAKTAATQQNVDDFKRRIEEKFVPTIQDIRGFHTYGVLKASDTELLSISIFEDRNGAT